MLKHFLIIIAIVIVLPSLNSQEHEFWSSSLELDEIQKLCNMAVSYSSCVIFLPSGETSHNDEILYIPAGVSLVGEGIENTIIENAHFVVDSSFSDNANHDFFRITGIFLKTDGHIEIRGCNEFRIDNCKIESVGSSAIAIKHSVNGLVDHCNIYATNYGIISSNGLTDRYPGSFTHHTKSIIGSSEAIYIEDCAFYNYHHGAVSHANAHMVIRYNTFNAGGEHPSFPVVAHGPGYINPEDTADLGSRLIECYSNTFYGPDTINNFAAITIGGGSAAINNNEFIDWENGVILTLDANAILYDTCNYPHDIWIWENVHNKYDRWDSIAKVTSEVYDHSPLYSEDHIRIGYEYFLRAPDEKIEGFTYAPYTYPHPYKNRVIIDPATTVPSWSNESDKTILFPNPTHDRINIYKKGFLKIELFNLQGVKLITSYSNSVDMSSFVPGHYIAKVVSTKGKCVFTKILVW